MTRRKIAYSEIALSKRKAIKKNIMVLIAIIICFLRNITISFIGYLMI